MNGKWLSRPLTGTGRYAEELMRSLVSAADMEFVLHVPRDAEVPEWLGARCTVIRHRFAGVRFEQFGLLLAARGGFLLNFAGPAPLLKRRQLVVMHDATPMRWPHSYSRRFRIWYRLMYWWLARTAHRLVTVSQFSRDELSDALSVPAGRFTVAPCGHEHFGSLTTTRPELPPELDVNRPFIVCIGTLALHKNLVAPTRALAEAGWQVLVIGAGGPSRVFAEGVGAKLSSQVSLLGRITDEELAWCYDHAFALVFPSFYEGFGLPVVEAQSRGCPVVASNAACLPEVVGDGGLLFPPDDHDQLVEHLQALCNDDRRRQQLIEAGQRNVQRFRWDATANIIAQLVRPSTGAGKPSHEQFIRDRDS